MLTVAPLVSQLKDSCLQALRGVFTGVSLRIVFSSIISIIESLEKCVRFLGPYHNTAPDISGYPKRTILFLVVYECIHETVKFDGRRCMNKFDVPPHVGKPA